MPAIQKPFNSKELRKREAKLRSGFNRLIKLTEAILPDQRGAKIVKQIETFYKDDFAELVKLHAAQQPDEPAEELVLAKNIPADAVTFED